MSEPPAATKTEAPPRLGLRDALIAAFVALQIYLPLSYYLGGDPFDERFAWRMFSPVRLSNCSVGLYEVVDGVERPIDLTDELHVVWINLLKRARPAVIDRAVEKFCAERGAGADVRIDLSCTPPDAVVKAICNGARDANGDGVPDAYDRNRYCDASPKDCFVADCGERSADVCYREECRMQVVPRDRNVCAEGAR
ncbi:MAG: hypothetical protein KC620_16275 [Myxococcales bacterium]|nr:hypothetical protein [Myxococcales bacterium]